MPLFPLENSWDCELTCYPVFIPTLNRYEYFRCEFVETVEARGLCCQNLFSLGSSEQEMADVLYASSGKSDGAGHEMYVWQDYVAGTDPAKPDEVFKASIAFDGDTGKPVVSWTPELIPAEAAKREYKIYGKVSLGDEEWTEVKGNAADFNFFKVTVEMK